MKNFNKNNLLYLYLYLFLKSIYAENTNPAIQHAITAEKQSVESAQEKFGQKSPVQQHPFGLQQQLGQQQQKKKINQAKVVNFFIKFFIIFFYFT